MNKFNDLKTAGKTTVAQVEGDNETIVITHKVHDRFSGMEVDVEEEKITRQEVKTRIANFQAEIVRIQALIDDENAKLKEFKPEAAPAPQPAPEPKPEAPRV